MYNTDAVGHTQHNEKNLPLHNIMKPCLYLGVIIFIFLSHQILAQSHPDVVPDYASAGEYHVGVTTHVINETNTFNPLTPTIKRDLLLEVWYPTPINSSTGTTYENVLRSGKPFSVDGIASRDAPFDNTKATHLVVLSHGYTGYRTIMFHIAEHLASYGYVVVGIDHTDSTNKDVDFGKAPFSGFISTLVNRSRDQQIVLEKFSQPAFISELFGDKSEWAAEKAGLIGYSMGGYGAINTIGGCFNFPKSLISNFINSKDSTKINDLKKMVNTCSAGQDNNNFEVDPRWQVMIALAPWGGQHGVFSEEALSKISVPSLLISGDQDDISGYDGITNIYQSMTSSDTFFLTLINARHNIAPHRTPVNAWDNELDFGHYYEPAWSANQLSNINKHFSLVMMECYLRESETACNRLKLSKYSDQRQNKSGLSEPWLGFDNRYSTGMTWQSKSDK